jgi:DNA-binding NtrC family response regulator
LEFFISVVRFNEIPFDGTLEELKRIYLMQKLEEHGRDLDRAAKALGLSHDNLLAKLTKHRLGRALPKRGQKQVMIRKEDAATSRTE